MTRTISLLILIVTLSAGLATAHSISAPAYTQAEGDGHFSYDVTITITDPIEFACSYTDGTDNTDLGLTHADGFCTTVIEPGVLTWTIMGNLLDPELNGTVIYEHTMCDWWTGTTTTVILAPTVPVETTSWSSIKALYH